MSRPTERQGRTAFLEALEDVIRARMQQPTETSYVGRLMREGERRRAQKVGEEAVELALAAAGGDPRELLEEAADLIFHVLVLLNARSLTLADVVAVLESRHRAGSGA